MLDVGKMLFNNVENLTSDTIRIILIQADLLIEGVHVHLFFFNPLTLAH